MFFRIKIVNILLMLFLQLNTLLVAQSGHFSQFYNVSQCYNPAETAGADAIRLVANYRSQWFKINKGFETYAVAFDMPIKKIGIGVYAFSNNAGKSSLDKKDFAVSVSKKIEIIPKTFLSFGVQLDLVKYQFVNDFQFDNQYDQQLGFDNSIPSGENFEANSQTNLDASLGLVYRMEKYSWKPKLSIALKDFVSKDYLFTSETQKHSSLLISSIELKKDLAEKLEIKPYVFYNSQNRASNLLLGSNFCYHLGQKELEFGAGLRKKDALIFYAGYGFGYGLIGVSYDANFSKLVPASHNIGGLELSLRMCFNKKSKTDTSQIENESLEDTIAYTVAEESAILPTGRLDTSNTKSIKPKIIEDTLGLKTKGDFDNDMEIIVYSSLDTNQIKARLVVYFDVDRSVLKENYKPKIDDFVSKIDKTKAYVILIHGHTDSDGESMYNIYLGQSRAMEVQDYLVTKGVIIQYIKPFSYGKTKPVEDGIDKKHLNRRVEVLLIQN